MHMYFNVSTCIMVKHMGTDFIHSHWLSSYIFHQHASVTLHVFRLCECVFQSDDLFLKLWGDMLQSFIRMDFTIHTSFKSFGGKTFSRNSFSSPIALALEYMKCVLLPSCLWILPYLDLKETPVYLLGDNHYMASLER